MITSLMYIQHQKPLSSALLWSHLNMNLSVCMHVGHVRVNITKEAESRYQRGTRIPALVAANGQLPITNGSSHSALRSWRSARLLRGSWLPTETRPAKVWEDGEAKFRFSLAEGEYSLCVCMAPSPAQVYIIIPVTLSPTERYNGLYAPPNVQGMRVVLGSPGWGVSRRGWWPPEV